MPHIEELPTTTKATAPGWSYVVDNGYDPSKAAINPANRKRVRISTNGGPSAGDLSARQQTAIQRHLEDLDKDSNKPVYIDPPKRKSKDKQTTNAKRILTSGKDFSHYLEEEEAALALKGGGGGGGNSHSDAVDADAAPKPAQRASKTPIARRKSAIVPLSNESSPAPPPAAVAAPGAMAPPPLPAPREAARAAIPTPQPSDLLLAPIAPTTITEADIEALLVAPPLSYSAARSAPPPSTGPKKRVFCEICGYWGRVKCMKCGARVCGFECQTAHDESRCVRF